MLGSNSTRPVGVSYIDGTPLQEFVLPLPTSGSRVPQQLIGAIADVSYLLTSYRACWSPIPGVVLLTPGASRYQEQQQSIEDELPAYLEKEVLLKEFLEGYSNVPFFASSAQDEYLWVGGLSGLFEDLRFLSLAYEATVMFRDGRPTTKWKGVLQMTVLNVVQEHARLKVTNHNTVVEIQDFEGVEDPFSLSGFSPVLATHVGSMDVEFFEWSESRYKSRKVERGELETA